jgi:signal transduction histidine kinase
VNDLALAEEIGRRAALAIDNAQLYDRAQHAIQARQDLLAIVSHDLGNPLGNILMSAEFLQKAIPAGPSFDRVRNRAAAIERSGERMKRLIMDLLDLASIEAGQLALELEIREVAPMIHEVIEAHMASAAKKAIKLESELPGEPLEINCDRERVAQVLGNLVNNAIKFTSEGGTITLRVERRQNEVLFSVEDSGVGMRPEDLPHVFDRFWQAKKAGRRGTGLGLSIAEGLVARHGGRIWVESTLGKGTTFFFTIPIVGSDLADA